MDSEILLPILKVLFMLAFLGIVLFFGTLPIRSKSFKQRPLLRTIGATFAGAIFINVALIHILPESADTLQEYFRDGREGVQVFPLANLLMMIGFLITVFFTKVLSFHSHRDDHINSKNDYQESQQVILPEPHFQDEVENSQPNFKQNLLNNEQKKEQQPSIQHKSSVKHSKASHGTKKSFRSHHSHTHSGKQNSSLMKQAYVLTIAMYFHTIFEGIAIGVQNSIGGFLSTAVAIAFHKWADALSMGCHYRTKNVSKKTSYILIIAQAFLNILSIGAGWLIAMEGDIVQAIFLSISAGTFLAISTLQMLGEQLHHKKYMKIKYGLMVGGTVFVSTIWFIENAIFEEDSRE